MKETRIQTGNVLHATPFYASRVTNSMVEKQPSKTTKSRQEQRFITEGYVSYMDRNTPLCSVKTVSRPSAQYALLTFTKDTN